MLISLSLLGCSNGDNSIASADKILKEYLGSEAIIPQPDNLSILSIAIIKPFNITEEKADGLYRVDISYGLNRGDLIEVTEQQWDEIEKNQGSQILYGVYNGRTDVRLEITNGGTVLADAQTEYIDGKPVQHLMEGERLISTVLTQNNLSYFLTFNIDGDYTEEDAMEFTSYLINELK